MGIQWLEERLTAITKGDMLIKILTETLNSEKPYIVELNKKQLENGQTSNGDYLRPYSGRTVKQRALEGNPVKGELIALFDTGDFWKGFWSMAYNGEWEIFSSDSKTNMLISEYGEDIFGLTEENFTTLGAKINEKLKRRLNTYLTA